MAPKSGQRPAGAQTPGGRATRSGSRDPLTSAVPSVKKTAQSYGSAGKSDIRAQMSATSNNFDDHLTSTVRGHRRGASQKPSTPIVEEEIGEYQLEEDEDEDDDDEDEEEKKKNEENDDENGDGNNEDEEDDDEPQPPVQTTKTTTKTTTQNSTIKNNPLGRRGLAYPEHQLHSDADRRSNYSVSGLPLSSSPSTGYPRPPAPSANHLRNPMAKFSNRPQPGAGSPAKGRSALPPVPLFGDGSNDPNAPAAPAAGAQTSSSSARPTFVPADYPIYKHPWFLAYNVLIAVLVGIACGTFVLFILWSPQPRFLYDIREKYLARAIWNVKQDDWQPIHQMVANHHITGRLADLEVALGDLSARVSLQEDGLKALQGLIPDAVVVRRTENGWQIPSDFWIAMAERMADEDAEPAWERFIAANRARLDRISRGSVAEINAAASSSSREGKEDIVSRRAFLHMIEENNAMMRDDFGDLLKQSERSVLTRVHDLAVSASNQTVQRSESHRLAQLQVSALGYANYVRNAKDALAATNWLADGQGARVDPHLTSPTMAPASSPRSWLYWKVTGYPRVLPPLAALQDWSEPGACWCASPNKQSSAQLAVLLPETIFPQQFVIEHVPKSGARDFSAAPKRIEFWAEVSSPQEAETLTEKIQKAIPQTDHNQCGGAAPGAKYVCIGTAFYDVDFDNWVQSFPTFVDPVEVGLQTRKVVVRAVENWGQKWTCFYRVRLNGQAVVDRRAPVEQQSSAVVEEIWNAEPTTLALDED